jgi:Transposase DDE domain
MDGKLWSRVYWAVMKLEHPNCSRGQRFSDRVIVLAYLLAVANDRPVCWACRPESWGYYLRPKRLPSQPTMSRRLRSPEVHALFDKVEATLRDLQIPFKRIRIVDGRPFPINPYSKDRDARWGYAIRGFARGYKLHAVWGGGFVPIAWELRSLNASEPRVAAECLLPRVPRATGKMYLVGDCAFDTNPMHAATAERGYQLLAPPKRHGRGLGHRPHHPARLLGLAQLQTSYGQRLYKRRGIIERFFGNWATRNLGLDALPAHVRRVRRVKQFVQAKIILNGFHILHHSKALSHAA